MFGIRVEGITPRPHSGNGISEALTYDKRFRLLTEAATKTPTTIYSLGLSYTPNGNVLAGNDSVNGNWTYGYDAFNRLTSAAATGQAYTYDYDRFGNRWHQNGPHALSVSFSGNNNRMDGFSYDAAGNLLYDGVHTYKYDAENRLAGLDGQFGLGGPVYIYDADGLRSFHHNNGGWSEPLYDLAGRIFLDQPQGRTEIYAAGRHLATYYGGRGGATYFNHADWLGTARARSTVAGSVCETITSLPFGDAQTITSSCADPSPMHFTDQERDTESGLDHLGARYDSSQYGRFMTPDPAGNAATCSLYPQTQNRYAYVTNNPVNRTDPSGLFGIGDGGGDFPSPPPIGIPFPIFPGGGGGSQEPAPPTPHPVFGLPNPLILLSNFTSSTGKSCARQALEACKSAGGPLFAAALISEEVCVEACALAGPGFPECAAACVAAATIVEHVALAACGVAAIATYARCKFLEGR